MTLILTCVTHEHIVQIADRRLTMPDGSLSDDDTNKAVFHCGQVAVAYTGLAQMEEQPTAQWIGLCMKDASNTELAMNRVAERAEYHLRRRNYIDKRIAVVATGWATLQGGQLLRPYICVASNCLTDSWEWMVIAHDRMTVQTIFLDENSSHLFFAAGQNLSRGELIHLNRRVRRAVEHGATTNALVRILGDTLQFVARSGDERAKRVGRGMIIHLLSRQAILEKRSLIATPLTSKAHSFLYVSAKGETNSFQAAVIACNGALLTNVSGATIPPGGKGRIRAEMEEAARTQPIRLAPTQVRFSAPCPFCSMELRNRNSANSAHLVEGELPLDESEAWIYCRETAGHLLLIQR